MKVSETARRMIMALLVLALIVMAAGAVSTMFHGFFAPVPFILGVLWITAVNVAKALLIDRMVETIAEMQDPAQSKGYVLGQFLTRFLLIGVALVVAALVPGKSFLWGAIAGLLTFQPAVYTLHFTLPKDNKASS